MLFSSQHENGENKLSSQDHLDEQTLGDGGAAAESGSNIQGAREHARDQSSGGKATHNLNDEKQSSTNPWEGSDEAHAESDSRVEQSSRDTEKDPSVDSEGKAETQRDVLKLLRVGTGLCYSQTSR